MERELIDELKVNLANIMDNVAFGDVSVLSNGKYEARYNYWGYFKEYVLLTSITSIRGCKKEFKKLEIPSEEIKFIRLEEVSNILIPKTLWSKILITDLEVKRIKFNERKHTWAIEPQ